jgi:hypothetical protein
MAEDKLGKTVRIDDKEFNPKGAKFEVWTKGRHKYIKWYRNEKSGIISTENYIDNNKISASLSDDEVIKAWLSQREAFTKFRPDLKVYKVIQDPYSDEPITKRVYGDGKSPYYLNNGCSINIEWRGDKPNPDFNPGTFSNPEDAEDYYRKKVNGVRNGPDRYLKTTNENPVILTSSVDDATDESKLPTSSWVIAEPFVMGIDINSQPEMSEPNYRDKSYVSNKVVTVNMPSGFTENGGKGYLVWTDGGLQYDSKSIPQGTPFEMMYIDSRGYGMGGRPRDQVVYFGSSTKDADIVSQVIEKFKSMVNTIHGIPYNSYDLKLCEPDSEACKLIEYKSPLEAPKNTPQQAAINDTPPGPSHSNIKIKLSIQGLFDSGDGTTPGSTSSVFEIKAKTDMPTFTVWTGEIPQSEEIDVFDDLEDLDPEYVETDAIITDEQQVELDLTVYLDQGDSEGTESGDTAAETSTSGGGVNTKGSNAGGSGDRRFQQQLTIRGRVVKNGEIPKDLLAKVDFGGYLLEKHAAVKFSALNKAFKEKFGKNFTISGPYRTIDVGINIFDWDLFNRTGACRKKGSNGKTAAAKPGTSKHGWGQAMDIGGFGQGPGNAYFDWMEINAKKYGWINPAWAKKPGAGYEPWHWEYIGDDLFAA